MNASLASLPKFDDWSDMENALSTCREFLSEYKVLHTPDDAEAFAYERSLLDRYSKIPEVEIGNDGSGHWNVVIEAVRSGYEFVPKVPDSNSPQREFSNALDVIAAAKDELFARDRKSYWESIRFFGKHIKR